MNNLLIDKCRRMLRDYLECSGKILYSAADTLKLGDIYFLGLNPGGTIHTDLKEFIGGSIELLPLQTQNEFLDDSWKGRKPGTSPLQKRVCGLLEELGYSVRSVCASNLIFMRSRTAEDLVDFKELADVCWPIHEMIITEIVKPRIILTHGVGNRSAYGYIKKMYFDKLESEETAFPSGHGNTKCYYFRSKLKNQSVTVIGIPHLSRFTLKKQAVETIRGLL